MSGEWNHYDEFRITLSIDGADYDGVLLNQWNPTTRAFDLTFSAIANNNQTVWGSKTIEEVESDSSANEATNTEIVDGEDEVESTTAAETEETETFLLWVVIGLMAISAVIIILTLMKRKQK